MTTRQDYYDKFAARLEELRSEIGLLRAKANTGTMDVKAKVHGEIERLREKEKHFEKKLHALRKSGDEAWAELKLGIDLAWKDLREGVTAARNRFK